MSGLLVLVNLCSIFLLSQIRSSLRTIGISRRKPTESVIRPGVINMSPATRIMTPSIMCGAGILPCEMSLLICDITMSPCSFASIAPPKPVRMTSRMVLPSPMMSFT